MPRYIDIKEVFQMGSTESKRPVAVITGASRGIGYATAERFYRSGYAVIVNYNRSEKQAKELCERLGEYAVPVRADVRRSSDIKMMLDKAYCMFERIDVLVNNAGIARSNVLSDVSDEEMDDIISVNLGGVIKCSREVLPYMLKTHSGSIVNVSSMWGERGGSCETVYSASKAGVIGFTKALAKELAISGIRVNCVTPGVIDTDMNSCYSEETLKELAEETPIGRLGTAYEVADAICFLAGDGASFITGQILGVDGGFAV